MLQLAKVHATVVKLNKIKERKWEQIQDILHLIFDTRVHTVSL